LNGHRLAAGGLGRPKIDSEICEGHDDREMRENVGAERFAHNDDVVLHAKAAPFLQRQDRG